MTHPPGRSGRAARFRRPLATGLASLPLLGCAPPFADLQNAYTLPPGRFQLTPSFSAVTSSYDGQTEHIENVYGIQVAAGLSAGAEFRLAFARVDLVEATGVNVLAFGPKFAVPGHSALYLPVGFAFGEDFDSMETWQAHPTLLFTGRLQNVEFNPSFKFLLPLSGGGDPLIAMNLGMGLSTDFDLWALRPEVGFLFDPAGDGYYTSFSFGVSITPPLQR